MRFDRKQTHWILGGALVIVLFLLLLKWRASIAAQASSPAGTLDATAGAQGVPISPQFQYGQQSPFQIDLGDYTAEIPAFHYSGNSTIYMPLFGFVGYGA